MAVERIKDPWNTGHFTEAWRSQDIMNESTRTARVRMQLDHRGQAVWIRLYPLEHTAVADQSYVVTVRTFNEEWLHWKTAVYGPFNSSGECDAFIETIPDYLGEDDRIEISFSILQKPAGAFPEAVREIDLDF